MKRTILIGALIASVASLVGCSTMASDPIMIQPGVYTISGENWGTYDSGVVRLDLIKQATAFCAKQGQQFYLLGDAQSDAFAYGKTATANINFKCVNPQ